MWISVDDVIHFHGLKPKHLNLEKDDTEKLNEIVSGWISQSEDLINTYTNRNYTDENVRDAVRNVCLRLTSNMVKLAIANRDSPIIKVNDWTIATVPDEVFSEKLKDDLKPFIKDSSTEPNSIGVLAITGNDELWSQ